ncbi:hypothetical protein [Burkholderia glumae]
MGTRKRWTSEDDAILVANYGKEPLQKIQAMLSLQRSEKSINMHAWTMGLLSGPPRENCQEKLLVALKEAKEGSGKDLANRAKIPEGSARVAMHLLRAKGLAHIGRIIRMRQHGKTSTFFVYRWGPGQDATEIEEIDVRKPQIPIPPRDEITAALFGVVPDFKFRPIPSRVYQQE